MGTLLAVLIVISLNLAPAGTQAVTIYDYVVDGVGFTTEATEFLLTRNEDGTWLLHDAVGAPWLVVSVAGPELTLTGLDGEQLERADLGAALGLQEEEWWAGEAVTPPNMAPLVLTHVPSGVDAAIDGQLAAELRWQGE